MWRYKLNEVCDTVYILSEDNVADMLTKPLPREITKNFTINLRLYLPEEKEEVEWCSKLDGYHIRKSVGWGMISQRQSIIFLSILHSYYGLL